jgi:subtilase family serine protease
MLIAPGAGASAPSSVVVPESHSPAVNGARVVSGVAGGSSIEFDVGLSLSDPAGASAFATAVSDPTSPSYGRYLTAAQWEAAYSPTETSVDAVTSWLRQQGMAVDGVTPDRMTVSVSATAAEIEGAFHTTLNEYSVHGKTLRLAANDLSVPADLAGIVSGFDGVDQVPNAPADSTGADSASPATGRGSTPGTIPYPPAFRNPRICSKFYGSKIDTTDPAYGGGYPANLPYTVCGYSPEQFESAYGLTSEYANGDTGSGVTVAVVDAYASPSLLADAQTYYSRVDPAEALNSSQFSESVSSTFNQVGLCGASGWFGEQSLDVEAVHAMAPGANILFVGTKNCFNSLFRGVQQVVDNHSAEVVTDSWGDNAGDVLDPSGVKHMFDNVLMMAAGTGVSVLFSSGDFGDEFATTGLTSADYPPSSPWDTAVGGTSLEVGAHGDRTGELGWSTSKSDLCTAAFVGLIQDCTSATIGTYLPPAPGVFDYGSGGGTSYGYLEPAYQAAVVPSALANRNIGVTGHNGRVEPDVSMDADPQTGMLIGETQLFPHGAAYAQFKLGGTSLASPLLAGVIAVADQVRGSSLGFLNPALYALSTMPNALFDVMPASSPQALDRVDFANTLNKSSGFLVSARTLTYEGLETYCDAANNCGSQNVALSTAPGFDSMTGLGTPGPEFVSDLAAS